MFLKMPNDLGFSNDKKSGFTDSSIEKYTLRVNHYPLKFRYNL